MYNRNPRKKSKTCSFYKAERQVNVGEIDSEYTTVEVNVLLKGNVQLLVQGNSTLNPTTNVLAHVTTCVNSYTTF